MEKSDNKKKILTIIASVIALIILVSASYAFFGSMKINTNNNATSRIDTKFYTFNTSGNQNVALTINESDLDVGSASNEYTSYVESNSNITLTLDAKGDTPVYCSYDIVYVPSTSYTPSQSSLKEYAVRGSSNQGNSFDDVSLGGSSKIKIYTGSIETTTSQTSISETWNFNLRYYNLNIAQDNSIIGKTFGGNIKVENIDCDFTEYAKNLYSTIARRYEKGDEFVKLYNGSDYGDTTTYANNIYYFNGAVENNNVLFADKCWKIVRTTDTGGVKMVYNGVQKDIVNTEPINQDEYINITNDVTYPYTFDETNKTWTSTNHDHGKTGTITFSVKEDGDYYLNYSVSSESNYDKAYFYKNDNIVGEESYSGTISSSISLTGLTTSDVIKVSYTKDTSGSSGSDNVVFSIGKQVGDVIKTCNNTGTDSQIGESAFNSDSSSPAYVGYMYNENKVYTSSSKTIVDMMYLNRQQTSYANSVTYNSSTKKYTLTNATTLILTSSNISTLVGKYICNSDTCTNVYYIVGSEYSNTDNSYYILYYLLSNGDIDGTDNGSNYVFGNSFTYENGTYTLTDTIEINTDTWGTNSINVNTHHYTCLTNGNNCSSIYYVFFNFRGAVKYITLKDSKSVDDALNEMLYDEDVNTNDSKIKTYIDTWYKNNMTSYTDKLEDTVFCNDRTMSNKSSNGWNPNGGSTTTYLTFKNYNTNYSLVCENKNDRFTVSTSNGNGALTYPVGLLTTPEAWLAYNGANANTYYMNTGSGYWLVSPYYFRNYGLDGRYVGTDGKLSGDDISYSEGVRPSISLKQGTQITSGDGTYTNPFVVE